jgi:hypothetical protein
MSTSSSLYPLVCRSLALAAFAGAGLAAAAAQTADGSAAAQTGSKAPVPALQTQVLSAPLSSPGSLFSDSSSASSDVYSPELTAQTQLASLEKSLGMPGANAMQYGQRRRYGAPRYRGGNTNPDGSEKYTGYAAVGASIPVSGTSDYYSTSYGLQVGAGRNFDRHFGVNVEFDYDKLGVTGNTINNQSFRYFGDASNPNGLDANAHIWSFSLQPTYQIYSGQGLGAYLTGGVGFYHKVTNFTLPQQQLYCDYVFGCYPITANANVDHYTSNAPGFDGGIGLTYKFSRFSNERLFAEARYVYVNNQYRPGATDVTAANGSYTGTNFFPENSNTTSYFPVKFGIRF